MSPEQAAGERDLDGRSDIYSLATVLYEMLAGQTPFQAATPQAMIARRFTEAPRPLDEVRDSVPAAIAHAVQKGLARTPADRYSSAADFARALAPAETAVTTPVAARIEPVPAPPPAPAIFRLQKHINMTQRLCPILAATASLPTTSSTS
jgi:serine/threonine-protein kinase